VSAAVTAMPNNAPLFKSVTLSSWPAGTSKSTKFEISVPTAPDGAPESSFCAVSIGLLVSSNIGASLSASTVRLAVSAAVEKPVVPPLLVVSASVPLLPSVWSQARKVMALASMPL